MKVWTWIRNFIFLIPFITFSASAGQKVAVIVNFGSADSPGVPNVRSPSRITGQGGQLRSMEDRAKALYKKLGYEVFVLSVNPDEKGNRTRPIAKELKSLLTRLKGVSELKMDWMGHGLVLDSSLIPPAMAKRFPGMAYSSSQLAGMNSLHPLPSGGLLSYVAVSSESEYLNQAQAFSGALNPQLQYESMLKESIGVGDVKEGLNSLKKNNPQVRTVISVFSCFSGALGVGLSHLPKTQIYTSGEAMKVTHGISKSLHPQTVSELMDVDSYLSYFYDEVEKELDQNPNKRVHWAQAHERAVQSLRKTMRGKDLHQLQPGIYYNRPQAPWNHRVIRWCLEFKTQIPKKSNENLSCLATNRLNEETFKWVSSLERDLFLTQISSRLQEDLIELRIKLAQSCNRNMDGSQGYSIPDVDYFEWNKYLLVQSLVSQVVLRLSLSLQSARGSLTLQQKIKNRFIQLTKDQIKFLSELKGEARLLSHLKEKLSKLEGMPFSQIIDQWLLALIKLPQECANVDAIGKCVETLSLISLAVDGSKSRGLDVTQKCQEAAGQVMNFDRFFSCLLSQSKKDPIGVVFAISSPVSNQKYCYRLQNEVRHLEFELSCYEDYSRFSLDQDLDAVRLLWEGEQS